MSRSDVRLLCGMIEMDGLGSGAASTSGGKVRFSSVQRAVSLNLELN